MIEDYVLAIDVSNIYASLGGEKADHRPIDKIDVLKQAKSIINNASLIFTFVVFKAEFTDDYEFMAVKERLFRVSIDEAKNYILNPKSLDNTNIFKKTVIKYGSSVQNELNHYIDNAKNYYKINSGGNGQLTGGLRVIQPPGSKQTNGPDNASSPPEFTQAPNLRG